MYVGWHRHNIWFIYVHMAMNTIIYTGTYIFHICRSFVSYMLSKYVFICGIWRHFLAYFIICRSYMWTNLVTYLHICFHIFVVCLYMCLGIVWKICRYMYMCSFRVKYVHMSMSVFTVARNKQSLEYVQIGVQVISLTYVHMLMYVLICASHN